MESQRSYINILPGDPAPWFQGRTSGNPNFTFDTAAGRYLVLCFFLSAGDAVGQGAIKSAMAHWRLFDDARFSFFGISADPRDEAEKRVGEKIPGYRFFLDYDGAISRLYGSAPSDTQPGEQNVPARRFWMVLDPMLRVLRVIPFEKDGGDREKLFRFLVSLPPPERFSGRDLQAPVLLLHTIFEAEFCQRLIALYEQNGGQERGFMREADGRTTAIADHSHKRRRDYPLSDEALIAQARERVRRRVAPEILKAYQFRATRMERYVVSCCGAEEGQAPCSAQRGNASQGTAHRRFAVSINLNDDFDGGEISFPEYGPKRFRMPAGGACVFSCSLLHKVSMVTRGKRYAFLPFLYDDEAAKIREQNNGSLGEGVGAYRG